MAAARDIYIFEKMSPEEGYQLLADQKATWLIRESNTAGMLSVDYKKQCAAGDDCNNPKCKGFEYKSARFALTSTGWILVSGSKIADAKKSQISNSSQVSAQYANQLLTLLSHMGFTEASRLSPKPTQQTRNDCYHTYCSATVVRAVRVTGAGFAQVATQAASGATGRADRKDDWLDGLFAGLDLGTPTRKPKK